MSLQLTKPLESGSIEVRRYDQTFLLSVWYDVLFVARDSILSFGNLTVPTEGTVRAAEEHTVRAIQPVSCLLTLR
jgi:hypothetical protein